jgi:serine/threonine protein kinase
LTVSGYGFSQNLAGKSEREGFELVGKLRIELKELYFITYATRSICRLVRPAPSSRRGRTSQVTLPLVSVYLGGKDNHLYALKVYHGGASKEDAFKIEVDFLTKLSFPNLINIVDSRLNAKVKTSHTNWQEERRPLIVLELAEGGELFDFLSKLGKFTP